MDETIPALFERQAAALAARPLFHVKRAGTYQPITWRQAHDDVEALSYFLLAQQVNPGDRVVILSENRPEWGIADLAIQAIGAWSVPLYPSLPEDEVAVICRDAEPVIGIASTPEQVAKLLGVSRRQPSLRTLIVCEADQQHPAFVARWADALTQGRALSAKLQDLLEHRRRRLQPGDTATLIYTSGTTGEPKGVMLSHRNFLSNVEACLRIVSITRDDLHLSFLPLSHVFERMAGWYLLLAVGGRIAYAESMDTVPQNILEVRPTLMLGVPRFFEKLYARIQEAVRQAPPLKRRLAAWALRVGQRRTALLAAGRSLPLPLRVRWGLANLTVFKALRAKLGGRLRFFISGSAPLSKDIAEFFYGVGVTILEGYGLTETSPVIAVNHPPLPRFGSVGPVLPGVEVRIAQDGEILTRGPHVMQGYYRKPDATAAILHDGWLQTGDIGRLDADGYLFITDRKKDLIKTAGGKFVAPQKLEKLLLADPYVSQAMVYGDRRPYCVALIVPNAAQLLRYAQEQEIPGRSLAELVRDPRIRDFYWARVQEQQQGLAGFERVKKIALLDHEFSQAAGELTPTLKAKRAVIAQRYDAVLNELYQQPAAPLAGPPTTKGRGPSRPRSADTITGGGGRHRSGPSWWSSTGSASMGGGTRRSPSG